MAVFINQCKQLRKAGNAVERWTELLRAAEAHKGLETEGEKKNPDDLLA